MTGHHPGLCQFRGVTSLRRYDVRQGVIFLITARRIQRKRFPGKQEKLSDVLNRHIQSFRELCLGRVTPQRLHQAAGCPEDLIHALEQMLRNSDRP